MAELDFGEDQLQFLAGVHINDGLLRLFADLCLVGEADVDAELYG